MSEKLNKETKTDAKQASSAVETVVMPELTPIEVSKYQRERDIMVYLAETIEILGGDDGPELDSLKNWLYRLRKKALEA